MRLNQFHVILCVFFATVVLMAVPSPADAQIPCNQCDCTSGCSTTCTYLVRECEPITQDGGGCTWETYYDTCSNHTCTTSTNCTSCSNLTCTSVTFGGAAGDTMVGTSGRDCLDGEGGNDTLYGGDGDDRLWGGTGTDTLFGQNQNDCMWGEQDNDHLDGGAGWDFGSGQSGADTCTTSTEVQVSC